MNRILCLAFLMSLVTVPVRAQDAALVERVNRLSVYVEELMADKARQQKQIADLTREVENLREQLAKATGGASHSDLAALADTVRELDRKHRADMDLVSRELEKLGTAAKAAARVSSSSSSTPTAPVKGYEYIVQSGDTLSAIVAAYQREGIKVTVNDVLQANPGLKPTQMRVGQKIIIPEK